MRFYLLAAIGALVCGAALAQGTIGSTTGAAVSGVPGRYAIAPAGDGFVRLDTQTGEISHCGRQDTQWLCEPAVESSGEIFSTLASLSEKVGKLNESVGGLATDVAGLRTDVTGLRQRTDSLEKSALRAPEAKLSPADQQEMDQMLSVTDQMMRRLFGLVAEMKRVEQGGK